MDELPEKGNASLEIGNYYDFTVETRSFPGEKEQLLCIGSGEMLAGYLLLM